MKSPGYLLALSLAFAGCSSSGPEETLALDGLTDQFARATSEVPSFGGFAFDDDTPVVLTLGPEPSAGSVVRTIFQADIPVRARPKFGGGSEALKDRATRLLLGKVQGVQSTDYDGTTGYVRVGAVTARAVHEAHRVLESAGYPTNEVIIEVEARISLGL